MDGSSNSSGSSDGDDLQEEESDIKRQNVIMDTWHLECSTCDKPLVATIFQDSEGYALCSPCRDNLPEIERDSAQRCYVMEKLVSTISVHCKHGCTGTIAYTIKEYGESTCLFGPCTCPISGCGFVARAAALLDHLTTLHKLPRTRIQDSVPFRVRVKPGSQVLYTQSSSPRFLLNIESLGSYGHAIYLACVRPETPRGKVNAFASFSRFQAHYQSSKLEIDLEEEPTQQCLCVVPGRETGVEVSIMIHTLYPHKRELLPEEDEDDVEDQDYDCEAEKQDDY